ncbi:hypothetical protein [Carboxylicivirga marina]|uniref:Secretion system C-terminal sorting domain-containing protein n=1 Tax=Carboxylicivirga marina TaxID=2800988 RepID=A0ABS1HKH6_9BACT|nr:hypothetical protein [Carboxylicivirga marina]MBK3517965.1 hypothetical protein [Carboxylicivirga marina]
MFIKPEIGISNDQDGSELYIYLNNERKAFNIIATGGESNYEIQNGVEFTDVKPGFYLVKLQIKSVKSQGANVGQLENVHLIGLAAVDAEIEMRFMRIKK